jgi:PEP-CTERM motif
MKLVKALLLGSVLLLPALALADDAEDDFDNVAVAPVPEPSAMLVMGVGLAAAVFAVRRLRK